MAVIEQEVSSERYIDIPEPVRDILKQWRPSPLYRARRPRTGLGYAGAYLLQVRRGEPGRVHKPNTAVAQAFYSKQEGVEAHHHRNGRRPVGFGAGVCRRIFRTGNRSLYGESEFQPEALPPRLHGEFGATCIASPSDTTESGRAVLAENPDSTGSLGIAISEAVERAVQRDDTRYALGSVLNHVLCTRRSSARETMKQLEMADDYPDIIVGCTGGGSNFAGIAFPFLGEKLRGGQDVHIIAVEPANCPTLTKGRYAYDFGDTGHLTPLVKITPWGRNSCRRISCRRPALPRHGTAGEPDGRTRAGAPTLLPAVSCFDAGVQFAKAEGILPAPEANHAVVAAIEEAIKCKEEGSSKAILFNLCGHGNFDMQAYMDYFAGKLYDQEYSRKSSPWPCPACLRWQPPPDKIPAAVRRIILTVRPGRMPTPASV